MAAASLIRTVTEALITHLRTDISAKVVLVSPDDTFEVRDVPSVLLIGPTIAENTERRTCAEVIYEPDPEGDENDLVGRQHPRFYDLTFELVVTTASAADLLDLQEKVAAWWPAHPVLTVQGVGDIGITPIQHLGGGNRVNLSNMRQATGSFRLDDVPVWSGTTVSGKAVLTRIFEFRGGVEQDCVHPPPAD